MTLDELMRFVGRSFEKWRVPYFVFGASAMNFWIPPRMTVDLDLAVCSGKKFGRTLVGHLRNEGFKIIKGLERKFLEGRKIMIPVGDTELDLKLTQSAHDREAFRRSRIFETRDLRLRVAVPEDIVLYKLQYWRRQDQADVERILEERADLEVDHIETWLTAIEKETGYPMRKRWKEILQ